MHLQSFFRRLLLLLVLLVGISAAPVGAVDKPGNGSSAVLPPVAVVGGRLVANNRAFVVRGVNYIHPTGTPAGCPELHFGADGRCPWRTDLIESDMARLQSLGVNTIRIFLNYYVFGGARETNPAYSPAPALAQLDALIASANRHDIYVMPVLLAKFPQNRLDAEGYGPVAALHVRPVLQHLAGKPGIIAWDLFNEPDIASPITERCWDWDNGDEPLCLELAKGRLEFLGRLAADVRALDRGRPLTIGVAFAKSYFRPLAAPGRLDELVDFYSFHYYDNDPFDSGRYAQHWYYGKGFPADLRRSIVELDALPGVKPVVVTELGFPSGAGALRNERALRADLRRALETTNELGAGVMLWPFQEPHEALVGDLFK